MGLVKIITEDLVHIGGKGITKGCITFLFNPSFRLLLNYRLGNYLTKRRNIVIVIILLWLKKRQVLRYNCDISFQATIGRRIRFPHPIGIVIGTKAIVGDDVMIWQNVTLGSIGELEKGYPTIKSGVKIFSNAQVIGNIIIGQYCKIGASSVVLKNIPDHCIAVGIPARII